MQITTGREEMVHSARAPIDKNSDSYSRKFAKRKKNGSIHYNKSKDKLISTTTRHLRTDSKNSIIPTPSSSSNLSSNRQKIQTKKHSKKSSRSNPRKERKSSNSRGNCYT
jgi:hypothetical protein